MNLLVEPIKEINIDEVDQDEDQKQKIPRKGKTRFDASTVELPANVSPEIWGDWIAHRSETGHPLTPTSTRKQLQTLARLGADATASIEASITNGWRGLFPPKKQQARRPLHDVSGGDRQNRDHPDYRPVRGQDAVMNDRRNQLLDQMQQLTEELD